MKPDVDDPVERWQRVSILLEALLAGATTPSFLDSGALVFAAPLLDAEGSVPQVGAAPYILERKLGRGGAATVYLAHDVKHDRRVAVKVLDAGLTARVGPERFVAEIRLTARLQHPHLLGLLDSGVFGAEAGPLAARPYYVMPYIEGESLRARLARGPLTVSEALRVLREVADALSYAHEQGVMHRDVKPENILLSRTHAVVADLGIAKALAASRSDAPPEGAGSANPPSDALGRVSSLVGTPGYMAPEQAVEGAPLDHRADLYAWGVVAYELLAHRHPFEGRTSAQDVIAAHARDVPTPLHEIAPHVPVRVAALVMRCLAKSPGERPGSAAEILAVLDSSRMHSASHASTSSRRRIAVTVTLGMLLLAGAFGGNARRRTRPILVIGTGDPAHDVPAVQSAADRGGDVTLEGHFSFATPPMKPVAPLLASGWYPEAAEILVSKAVNIAGVRDARGEMATIVSGTIPFYVDAPGERVTIRGLRFVRPIQAAILVRAVRGLEISSSTIDGVVPFSNGAGGISINTRGEMPLPSSPGAPEGVSGHLLIAHNEIDVTGGTARMPTAGLTVFSVGRSPDSEVELDIFANHISNSTAPTINIRRVDGRVRVLGNTLQTSPETIGDVDAVRLVNGGSILMANNSVECSWPNAAGIQVFSPFAEWPTQRVRVEDNNVLMSPPAGAPLGDFSAGISIRGFAHDIMIRHNRITGRARAALSMYAFRGGTPSDNAFIDNDLARFEATVADIVVGSGVARGHIVGAGSLSDHGTATIREQQDTPRTGFRTPSPTARSLKTSRAPRRRDQASGELPGWRHGVE